MVDLIWPVSGVVLVSDSRSENCRVRVSPTWRLSLSTRLHLSVWLRTRPRRHSLSSRRRSDHRCHVPRSTMAIFGLFCAVDRSAVIFLHVQDGGLPIMQFDVGRCLRPEAESPDRTYADFFRNSAECPDFSGIRPNIPFCWNQSEYPLF